MGAIIIHTDNLRGHVAPLYRRYPQQSQPQPAYITITEDGDVSAGHSGEVGDAVPMAVWHHRTLRVPVHAAMLGDALADLLESAEARALLERIHAGHSIEWDGSNHVGRLSDDARAALDDLHTLVRDAGEDTSMLAEVWTADAWLGTANDLLDVWPAGEPLDAAVKRLEDLAAGAGVVIDGDIRESLLDVAARMHERGEDGLSREHLDALVKADRITRTDADAC